LRVENPARESALHHAHLATPLRRKLPGLVSGFGFRVSGFDFGFQVSSFRFRISNFGLRVPCFGFLVSGSVSRVSGLWFRV